MKSLPGDPLNPRRSRSFRVDEDGNVIYLDDEQIGASPGDRQDVVRLAELDNSRWNGPAIMGSQAQRDAQVLKEAYEHFFPPRDPNAPLPPASRTYPLLPGQKAVPWDPQHRFIQGKDGSPIKNPEYERAYGATKTDKVGVAKDLGMIAAGALWPLRGGAMALEEALKLVGLSAAKDGYDLTAGRGSRKGAR